MSKFCCQNCFNDDHISQIILDTMDSKGSCDYCGSTSAALVEPRKLFFFIEQLDIAFEEFEEGELLIDILSMKLKFFKDSVLNKQRLFEDIIDSDLSLKTKKYKVPQRKESLAEWSEFSNEIKSKNRFFPRSMLATQTINWYDGITQTSAFNVLVESLTAKIIDDYDYYRARISNNEERFEIKNMFAPPHEFTSAGRANPVGISYLYLAENIETCIAEVRPSNDGFINIAQFKTVNINKVIDLTNPREKASIFKVESENLANALKYIDLLEIFALELSKPIQPNRAHLDYIPTQFLCEYFKTICRYEGILFNSSFGKGKNLVLFNESFVNPVEMKYFKVVLTEYTHKEVETLSIQVI